MSSKVFFPNLNGIRFIAAFVVIIHHVEQLRNMLGVNSYWNIPGILIVGKLGVVLFFVLSGFLITYLILKEKEITQTIAIKEFYTRRILRIWPLYFLIAFLAFFVLPNFTALNISELYSIMNRHFIVKVFLYAFIMPNLALTIFAPIPYASQAWSIGVEEQFYLIWPILLKLFSKIIYMLVGVIIVFLVIKIFINSLLFLRPNTPFIKMIVNFWNMFSIDCMAIGGIAAWAIFEKKTLILNIIFNKIIQFVTYAILVVFIVNGIIIPYLHYETYAVLFAIVIVNLACNPKSILNLENKMFNYLGKISYGLYMFHSIAIIISLNFLNSLSVNSHTLHYILTILLTIIFSALSYHFFELKFIKKKIKFSKVLSGDNA